MTKATKNGITGAMGTDAEGYLLDEFRHNSALNTQEVQNPKQLLGSRMRYLRIFRGMTQEETAEKAGINTALWRHYEHGMKMPRQDRLEKIAEVLRVPVQMLQPIDTYSPAGIAAVLYNMRMQYQEPEVVEMNGETYLKIPKNDKTEEARATLEEIQKRMNAVTFEDAMECYFREVEPNMPDALKEHAREYCEKYKAYVSGNLREDLPVYDTIQANTIADYEWSMKNQILIEYITELYEK